MKRFFFLLIVCISFFACKPGIPKEIIQPDKMEQVLLDVHVLDGYIGGLPGVDTAKKVASAYYKGIYKKYDIDSVLYHKSMDYYYNNPTVMKKIYDSLTVKLTKLKEEYAVSIDPESTNVFKGIFVKDTPGPMVLDYILNLKYNLQMLRNHVFVNIMANGPIFPAVNPKVAEPILAEPVKVTEEPVAPIAEPVKVIRNTQQ
ncbi:MAG: DUF4296 domain-containing protein [Pedobacter sp.]|nr:MAG: DUF4296 domain-containing protein [Pedobacter sp.]